MDALPNRLRAVFLAHRHRREGAMPTDFPKSNASDLLRYLRGRPGHDPTSPTDVPMLCDFVGMEVWDDHTLPEGGPVAVLNVGEKNVLRLATKAMPEAALRRFATAVAMGHVVLHKGRASDFAVPASVLVGEPGPDAAVQEALAFAMELLMPVGALRAMAVQHKGLGQRLFLSTLSGHLGTPPEATRARLNALGLMPASALTPRPV